MRSAFVTAALAAGVLAKPIVVERDYVTEVDVVTTVITVTAGQALPTSSVAASSEARSWAWGGWSSSAAASSAPAATSLVVVSSAAPATSATPVSSVAASSAVEVASSSAPASSAAASSAAGSATVSAASSTNTYNANVLNHHNVHRANHSASDVTWDDTLASTALEIANSCMYAHNTTAGNANYGQNIAAGAHQDNISSVITEQFYNSEMMNFNSFYGEATPSDMSDAVFDGYGHFTQIVWKGTTTVGCATVDCTGKGNGPNGLGNVGSDVPPYFTVCNYGPPGNYLGEFDTNVAKPLGNAVVHWDYDGA